ncbi:MULTISPECIES: recombinase family protein [unclassified Pseudofrankia]|uniref:recombinase family protein n=1 Tax=unclassified Pseudofrankia TaxID=2994372 RepID=UPI000924239D|nr:MULTISPECIES: recombinase family protein [unclassified Pseudofrankia]MDT3444513.1 recombinase family protein [Pseudofrankia sp. BMG5.37]OHV56392.1 hypothetical protein BCD48_07840 [Pseudofrankia sp. BMG5.36]
MGTAPYSYTRNSGHSLATLDDEITIVKLIFRLYTRRRLGCRAIAAHLNERNLVRRRAHHKAIAQPGTSPEAQSHRRRPHQSHLPRQGPLP